MRLQIIIFSLLLTISCSLEQSVDENENTSISLDDSLVSIDGEGNIEHQLPYANKHKITLREYKILEKIKSYKGSHLESYSEDNSHHITWLSIYDVPFNYIKNELNSLNHLSSLILRDTGIKDLRFLKKPERIEYLFIKDKSLKDTLEISSHWKNMEYLAILDSSVHVISFPKQNKLRKLTLNCDLKHIDSSFFYLKDLEYLETNSPLVDKMDRSSFKKLKYYYFR